MRLIDGDSLMKTVFNDVVLVDGEVKGVGLILAETVDKAPTIDAVPVVRCDKCKHFKHDEANDEWYCKKSGADIEYVDSLTHFCSYGERKEGAD